MPSIEFYSAVPGFRHRGARRCLIRGKTRTVLMGMTRRQPTPVNGMTPDPQTRLTTGACVRDPPGPRGPRIEKTIQIGHLSEREPHLHFQSTVVRALREHRAT